MNDTPTARFVRPLEVTFSGALDADWNAGIAELAQCSHDAFANSAVPMWIYDHATLRVLDVNAAALRTYGYSREEFLSLRHVDIRVGCDIAVLRSTIHRHGAYPRYVGLVHHRTKSGDIVYTEGVEQNIIFNGASAGLVIAIDVSKQRAAEQELKRTNERLSVALEASRVTVCSQDVDLFYTWTQNPGMGFSRDEVVGKYETELYERAEDAQAVLALKRKVLEGGYPMRGLVEIHRQGVTHTMDLTVHPQLDEGQGVVGLLSACVDITDRMQDELVLRETREQLNWILNSAGIGLWSISLGLDRWDRDARTKELFLVPEGIERGMEVFLKCVHPVDRARVSMSVQQAIKEGGSIDIDHRVVDVTSGTVTWIRTKGRAKYSASGIATAFSGLSFDITAQKEMEFALRHSEDVLRQKVAQRSAEVKALSRELTLAEERERQAIAMELHDGLVQILSLAQVTLEKLRGEGRPADRRKLCDGLGELIRDAELGTRSLMAQLAPPVLGELGLVPALEWLTEEYLRKFGLKVRLTDDGAAKPFGKVARAVVFRVVRELLINVAKHAMVDAASISIETWGEGCTVVVEDAGVGFEPRTVFERSTPGFGLVSVRERIELLGGRASFVSAPGAGTVVRLTIPFEEA